MKLLRYVWKNSRMKIMHIRMAAFIMTLLIISLKYQAPLKAFSQDMNYPCSIWVFPFMLTREFYLSLFYFAVIYVNSDIPFMQHANMYQVIRTGRRKWALAQMGGIFVRSFIMVMIAVLLSVVCLLPDVEMTGDWGKLIRTIASTDLAQKYYLEYGFYYDAIAQFTPLQLMGIAIAVLTLITAFLGFLMYAVCLYIGKIGAVTVASGLSVMLFFVVNLHFGLQMNLSKWIPTIWAQVSRVESPKLGYYWLPSISYMVCFLVTAIVLLGIIVLYRIKRVEFDWEKEDM